MPINLNEIIISCSTIEQIYIVLNHKVKKIKNKNNLCKNCNITCCTNTINMEVTFLEWSLIKEILDENKELSEKVKNNSKSIVYNNDLRDLVYKCPFLIDNECSIHLYRPLYCRTYGYFYKNNYDKTSCALIKNYNEVFDEDNFLYFTKMIINKLNNFRDTKPFFSWIKSYFNI